MIEWRLGTGQAREWEVSTMGATARTSFGALLRYFRLAAGLTQATLAERGGLSERAINDLERDPRRTPRLETVTLLAEALALSHDDRSRLMAAARPEVRSPEHPSVAETPLTPTHPGSTAVFASIPQTSQPLVPLPHGCMLPAASSPFVGRVHEVEAVCARLAEPGTRLLTLTGPGGIGKTRLALQVATVLEAKYADGVRFVDLGPLTDPSLVLPTIAAAFGIAESVHQSPVLRFAEALRARQLLLVLDNFEQVTSAAVEIEHLLAACPTLTILVTSRAVLHLAREREYHVPPLTVPDPAHLPAPSDLLAYDAVALLAQSARAVVPDFTLTEVNAGPVAAICARLEGVPLAIQLAAARIKLLPPAALLSRLDQQLAVLTGGPQDAPERQRTVRATLDWSYHLLTPAQQALLRRLAVFTGGWTLDAAEGVCAGDGADGVMRAEVFDLLAHLVDQSLVLVEGQAGTGRYRLLETVRQYSLEKLCDAGEEAAARNRHLAWFLQLAEGVESQTWIMPLTASLSLLKPEADNYRAALAWSGRDISGQTELRLAGSLTSLWHAAGAINEGRKVLRDVLDRADPAVHTRARARALMAAVDLAGLETDPAGAIPLALEAVAIFQELGDDRGLAQALTLLARVRHWAGDPTAFVAARDEALSICRKLGDLRAFAETLWLWGDLALDQGDYPAARRQLEECMAVCRRLNDPLMLAYPLISLARVACAEGDVTQARKWAEDGLDRRKGAPTWLLAIALNSLGEVERCAGNDERAAELFSEALAIFRDQDTAAGIAWSLHNLGHIALRAGTLRHAADLFAAALTSRYQHGYASGIASELASMGGVSRLAGEQRRAARLFGAAETLLERSRNVLAPADLIAYERDLAALRAQMEESALKETWALGRALSLEQAVAEALCVIA